jgi:hypothetical protein
MSKIIIKNIVLLCILIIIIYLIFFNTYENFTISDTSSSSPTPVIPIPSPIPVIPNPIPVIPNPMPIIPSPMPNLIQNPTIDLSNITLNSVNNKILSKIDLTKSINVKIIQTKKNMSYILFDPNNINNNLLNIIKNKSTGLIAINNNIPIIINDMEILLLPFLDPHYNNLEINKTNMLINVFSLDQHNLTETNYGIITCNIENHLIKNDWNNMGKNIETIKIPASRLILITANQQSDTNNYYYITLK